jgi:hypothetical protein
MEFPMNFTVDGRLLEQDRDAPIDLVLLVGGIVEVLVWCS